MHHRTPKKKTLPNLFGGREIYRGLRASQRGQSQLVQRQKLTQSVTRMLGSGRRNGPKPIPRLRKAPGEGRERERKRKTSRLRISTTLKRRLIPLDTTPLARASPSSRNSVLTWDGEDQRGVPSAQQQTPQTCCGYRWTIASTDAVVRG